MSMRARSSSGFWFLFLNIGGFVTLPQEVKQATTDPYLHVQWNLPRPQLCKIHNLSLLYQEIQCVITCAIASYCDSKIHLSSFPSLQDSCSLQELIQAKVKSEAAFLPIA